MASSKAIETGFGSRVVFNGPAVGAHYAKLAKKNKDGFDLEHWTHTRPAPFPPSPLLASLPPFPALPDQELSRGLPPLAQETRTDSFMSASSGTAPSSVFSSVASGSTRRNYLPSTPSANLTSFCLSSAPPLSPVHEHTAEIKAALTKSLKKITPGRRILPQTLTKFSRRFVAPTAHYLSGNESVANNLPDIRVPCLAINCAKDSLIRRFATTLIVSRF